MIMFCKNPTEKRITDINNPAQPASKTTSHEVEFSCPETYLSSSKKVYQSSGQGWVFFTATGLLVE